MEFLILYFDRSESLVLILIHFSCFCFICDIRIFISMIKVRKGENRMNPAGRGILSSGQAREFQKKISKSRHVEILACQLL